MSPSSTAPRASGGTARSRRQHALRNTWPDIPALVDLLVSLSVDEAQARRGGSAGGGGDGGGGGGVGNGVTATTGAASGIMVDQLLQPATSSPFLPTSPMSPATDVDDPLPGAPAAALLSGARPRASVGP